MLTSLIMSARKVQQMQPLASRTLSPGLSPLVWSELTASAASTFKAAISLTNTFF
jgi:hypothetical protein